MGKAKFIYIILKIIKSNPGNNNTNDCVKKSLQELIPVTLLLNHAYYVSRSSHGCRSFVTESYLSIEGSH